ncbi:bactofilin family protein [Nautilia sp.]
MGVFNKSESVNNETTVVSSGAVFKGNVDIKGNIHIDGTIEGNINSMSNISIGKKGKIIGDVKCKKLVISGIFEGKADCDEIEVLKGGKLKGEVNVLSIIIEKGGDFDGTCHKKNKDVKK